MPARARGLMIGAIALLLFAVLAVVGPRRPDVTALPSADLSSPEQALKSYWRVQDWMRRNRNGSATPDGKNIDADELLRQVTSSSVHSSFAQRPLSNANLAWSIESIERVSDQKSIALVRIRNLDRNPEVLTPTPVELFNRSESVGLFRYVLSYEASQWKIAEVWQLGADGSARRLR